MGSYTITITPEEGHGARTTVRVDLDGDTARIVEVAVRSPDGASVSEDQLSLVDLDLLMRAVRPALEAAPAEPMPVTRRNRREPTTPAPAAKRGAKRAAAKPAKAEPAKAAGRPPAKATTTRASATRKAAAASASPTPASPSRSRSASTSATQARAYRRVPEDLLDRFEEIGTVTALAAHYGVPRHTAQGWINRMRQQSAA